MEEVAKFSGQVCPGRGKAARKVRESQNELRRLTGTELFEGSLNVILSRPLMLSNERALRIGFGPDARLFWPATLDGVPVWIYRWVHAPLHVAELLSCVQLRQTLGLDDFDVVTLTIQKDNIGTISIIGKLTWNLCWLGRRRWCYTRDTYYRRTRDWCIYSGATQYQRNKTMKDAMKNLIKRTPILGPVAMKISRSLEPSSKPKNKPFEFERLAIDPSADNNARSFTQVQNVLNYTKTSQSSYSAKLHPAGYHTIEINGQTLTGQRNPSQRLDSVPFDFNGKSVLDIGCNQGGMLLQLDGTIKWGVGLDYDSRLINAANRIKALRQSNDLQFYSFDLEKDPLPLIEDLIPEPKVDIVFLLSICMWIDNWKDVIQFAARISDTMLFETNGTPEQQTAQRECLDRIYQDVALLNEASEDDPGQKKRTLLLCARPRR